MKDKILELAKQFSVGAFSGAVGGFLVTSSQGGMSTTSLGYIIFISWIFAGLVWLTADHFQTEK